MTVKIFINGVPGKEKKKFPLDRAEVIIKAKKGYMYANPFILQPMEVSPKHQSIPKFIHSQITRLVKNNKVDKQDKYLIIFNKQGLPNTEKAPNVALVDKYMLTNGKVQARWINKTELIIDLSHLQDYKALRVTSGASLYPFVNKFSSNLQLSQFIQSTQAKILSNFPQEFTSFIPSLYESSSNDCTAILDQIEVLLRNMISKQNSSLYHDPPTDSQVQFYPISDKRLPSMIVRKGNKIKSVPLNQDGTYDLDGVHFGDPPKYIDDEITLHLPINNICKIFKSLNKQFWPSIDSKNIMGALLLPFLKQFASFLESGQILEKAIYVPCVYKDALLFFQILIVLIQKELQSLSSKQSFLFSDLQKDEQRLKSVIELPFYGQPLPAEEAKQQKDNNKKEESKQKQEIQTKIKLASSTIKSSYYQLLELLCIASKFEDQLYALSQSNEASNQLKQLWNSSIRIHTAFGRLSSFTSASEHFFNHYTQEQFGISNHSAYKMADAGLLAVRNDNSTSFRLWTSSSAFIPTSDISRFSSISQLLSKNYPQIYDNIISKFNIPLSHTIKYLPAVKFAEDNVFFIKPAEKRIPYLLVGYTDQTIAIINGKIRPFPIMTISLKTGQSGSTIAPSQKSSIIQKSNFEVEILQSQKSKEMRLAKLEEKLEVSPSTKQAQQIIKAYTINSTVDKQKPEKLVKIAHSQVSMDDPFLDQDDQDQDELDSAFVGDMFPLDCQEEQPKDTPQSTFEPNAQTLQLMLSMGFDYTISIQALKKCQNKSLEAAIDAVQQIQSEIENKIKQLSMPPNIESQKPKQDEKESNAKEEIKQEDEPEQVKQKRQLLQNIYENGRILDIHLIEVNQFTASNVIKYRIEVLIYSESMNKIAFFSSDLRYSYTVIETVGHLHKSEDLHLVPLNSLNGPEDKTVQRFDLRSILPLYSQTVDTLLPLFTKRRTAFQLEGVCSDPKNFQIFQDVKSISSIRSFGNQNLSIISGKNKTAFVKLGKNKLLQAQLEGPIDWQEVEIVQGLISQNQSLRKLFLAKIKSKNELIILKQQEGTDNKLTMSPVSQSLQLDFDISLSDISLSGKANVITVETPQTLRSYSASQINQKSYQIKALQAPKPQQALTPSFESVPTFLERGFYSLSEQLISQNLICKNPTTLELPNMSLLNQSLKPQPTFEQTLMFKHPIQVLTSIDITCTFTQNQLVSIGEILNSSSVQRTSMSGPDYRYMNQILNHYAPVTSSSTAMTDHPLSLKLVSKNQSNTQSNIGCILTYPKILLDSNTGILQANPYLQENDSDFLFEQIDGKKILVTQLKFELMFEWGEVTMLVYTGDSIQQIYANDTQTNAKQNQQTSPQKRIQFYQTLLQHAKTSGKQLSQADPVALIKVTKSNVNGYQANLGNSAEKRFNIQFKRPARYLRIKILDKLSKKSGRYLINCFQAFGSQVQDMYLSRSQYKRSKFNDKKWIQSGYEAKIEMTLKSDNNQGTIAYEQVEVVKRTGMKQERNQIKITDILSPDKRRNTQIEALSQLKSLDIENQAKLGRFTTLSYLSIPIIEKYQNVIGIKVKLFKKNPQDQQQQKIHWIPQSINIRAYQQTYPLLHLYRYKLLNFQNFNNLVELAHISQKGVNLMLKLLQERPDFIDKYSASIQIEQIISNVLFGQSHDTTDIYSILQLISIVLDSGTMQQEFMNIGKSYLKLQRFITQSMTRSGVYFLLSLCKYHFNEATNIEFLDIFQALNSLIFTKFSKLNPQALNAFNEAKNYYPVLIPKQNFQYEILQKKDVELISCDNSHLYQKPFKAISVKFPSNVGYFVKEIVIQFTKNKDFSSSHFPDWGFITANIDIDAQTQGYKQISARFSNFLGICNRYSIQFSSELFVRQQILISHLSGMSEPILNMGAFSVTVFGLSLNQSKAQFTNQRYRFEVPSLPSINLPQIQQEALQSLPHKPKKIDSLLKLLIQSKSISESIVQSIINSIQQSPIELSSKQAEKCFNLWMQLPQDFPWQEISNKIQYMSKVIFTKVPSYDAANVSIQQLRSCLIGGKSAVSHSALLKFIQGLGFPSNFIYAYLQRYFGGSNTNTATSTQFNASKFKSESSNNFIFLYILAQLSQNLPYTTGDPLTVFKNQGKIKLSNYTDITLPTARVQKNKIISNIMRGLLQNSEMYTLQELVALLRILLLSLVMGIKPDPTDVIKYLYGDVGKRQNSLMAKLITITIQSKDPELKILMSNLANLTKSMASISQHVEAPLIMLNRLVKQLPKETLKKGNDLTVSQWIAKVKYLICMTSWKSNLKMKDFIFSLCSQVLPQQCVGISNSGSNPCLILCQSYQFWQLLTDLIYRLRSNISSKSKEAVNFCQNFIIYASQSNKTEFFRVAVIISVILQDLSRDQTSEKSKMAKILFRAVFNMLNVVRTQNEWNSILGFVRQIFSGITISLNQERAFLFHLIVTHLLNKIQKWSLDDPSCANLISSQYVQLAYQTMQKIYSQKDAQACANVFATVLAQNQLQQIARGMVKWFFLTEEISPSKQCNNQEHCIRFITDGLYKMFVILCETQSFRKKAMIAIMETVITIDESVLDEEFAIKPAVEISGQCNSIFGGLLRLTITTKKQCEMFLRSYNGIQFLENRLRKLNTGNMVYDMIKNSGMYRDNSISQNVWKYQQDWTMLKEPLIKSSLTAPKKSPSSASISSVPSSTASNSSIPSVPSTPSSSKTKKTVKPVPLSMSKYKMSAKKATDSKKQSTQSGLSSNSSSSRLNTSLTNSMSNQINNANDSSSIIQAPVISFPYNRYAYSVATSFQVSAKSQSEGSDLFKNLNALSIVNSSQYWNLTNTQVGDTCDFDKIFNPADIQIQNYANKKITKIEQKSTAKFNKDFNWSNDGIRDGGSHVNLSLNYSNDQSLSFQINQTIELKDITIAFNNILSSNSSNRPIPTSVNMNFGLTQDMRNSVKLQRIHDPHFGMSAVYGINMHTVSNSCKTLRRAMQNFKRLKVRFINFSIQKGYYFGVRKNINQKLLSQNNSEILKFLQINGYPVTNVGNYLFHIGIQRRLSTLNFISQLLKDNNKLQSGALLHDVMPAIDQGLMKSYLSSETKLAMEFLQVVSQQIKDEDALESILRLVRRFIEQKILTTQITVSQIKEIKKLVLKLIFSYKGANLDEESVIERASSSLNLQAIIRRMNGWIEATNFRIEQRQIPAAKYLAEIVTTVLLIAAKEHVTLQGNNTIERRPLIMEQYPKKEHILNLAKAVIAAPQDQQLINLLSLFLNPPLGLAFSGFKAQELYQSSQGNDQIQNLIHSIISSSNNQIAQNQFQKLQAELLVQTVNIIHNPQKQSEHILVTKILQWAQRYSIRKSLVEQDFGIQVFINLKSNFPQVKSITSLVQKLVSCIKKLVYGFPQVQDRLAKIILQDDEVFDQKNQDFNSCVLFPLLFGEQTLNIALNPFVLVGDKRVWLSLPDCPNNSTQIGPLAVKLLSTYASQLVNVSGFPMKSTVFTPQQKRIFSKFYANTLTPGQHMLMQLFKFTSEGNLSLSSFSSGCNLLSFGTGYNKSTKINYFIGIISLSSVESLMKLKGDASQHSYFFIYSDGPNSKQYHHFRLKPKFQIPGKKSVNALFQLDNKSFYFPSKEKFIFKLEENKSHGSASPYGLVFCTAKPSSKDQNLISLDSSQKFAGLTWPFSVKQSADDMPPIYMKVVSGQVQSFLNYQNVNQMIKGYEFSHPFFQTAKMEKTQFSYMSEEEVKRNPWHDKNNDFMSRLNPKWRIPQGATLKYIIEQLFSIKMTPDLKINVHKNGNLVNLNNKLSELIIEHNDIARAIEQQDEEEEKKIIDIEFKQLIEGQRRKIKSQSQTMEFDIDLTNLLEIYCTNKFNSTFSASQGAFPSEPKKIAAKKKGIMIQKKFKKISSELLLSTKKQQSKEAVKQKEQQTQVVNDYQPELGLFKSFSRQAGFNKIVKLLRSKISSSKSTQESVNQLTAWLQQIEDFSKFPNYEQKLLKNKQCRDFFLEDVIRSENIVEKFLERKEQIRNVPFQTLSALFSSDPDPLLRKAALDKNIIKNVLRNIQALTNEISRKYDQAFDKDQEAKKILQKEEQAKRLREKKQKQEEQIKNTDKKKRKGVGYVTNEGTVWNVQQYMKDREARNQRVGSFIDFIASLFDSQNWQPTQDHTKPLLESCLLPLIESSFTAGSLVNLVKDFTLVMAVFNLVTVLVRHKNTARLLIKIDQKYRPPQRQAIFELMKKLKELSDIFLKCLGNQQQNMKSSIDSIPDHKGQDVAKAIQSSFITVERYLMEYKLIGGDEQIISDALSLPLPQAYIALLKDLRFDYMKLNKTNGKFVHYYESQAQQQQTSPPSKMVRLAQQLADLSTALPIDHTNAIFVRVDRERIDLMKAIIFGANNTPYAHGAFEYDLYLPQKYPQVCPKCNLTTTGSGQVRFNPNLYSSGKVCLSLLGTWRGNANQNWDPKVSTILQVLLSIQAVVMSEEVYFNEPGYENTAGTPQGEKKNEGYSNIVKYANIKYAMIEQIKNPPKGFESVIRRHFYLKRNQIIDQVKSWIPLAEKNQANYSGLVSSHNWKWCELFKKQRLTFRDKLVEVITELQNELKKLSPPSIRDVSAASSGTDKKSEQKAKVDLKKEAQSLENIDVDDEDQATAKASAKEMDISDQKVKDRWSRYIGAMGVDAVAKQAAARVLVSGAGALGIEIAKNIVLAGCKSFTLHDNKPAKWSDISGQFFLTTKDISKNRAAASINKLQQLNFYVKVNQMTEDIDEACVKSHDVIIITDPDSIEQVIEMNNWCRKYGAKFILAEACGLFARVFDDFGHKFQVLDKNGEELQEVMIKQIKQVEIEEKVKKQEVKIQQAPGEEANKQDKKTDDQWITVKLQKCQVELLQGVRHNFQDGDLVILSEIQGMNLKTPTKTQNSVNGQKFEVKIISPSKFTLQDLNMSLYTPYVNNGICKQLKQPIEINFKSFQNAALVKQPIYDMNLMISDFQKMAHWDIMHIGMMNLTRWKSEQNGGLPPMNTNQASEFIKSSKQIIKESGKQIDQDMCNKVLTSIAITARGVFNPICSFIGGMVAQECVKAITGKFSPLNQLFYFNAIELLPELPKKKEDEEDEKEKEKEKEEIKDQKLEEDGKKEDEQQGKDLVNKGEQTQDDKQKEKKEMEENDIKIKTQEHKKESFDYLEYWTESSRMPFNHKNQQSRDCGLIQSIGVSLTEKLSKMKLFMVGAGAIGCELLKNYAMLGIGASDDGLIVLTDPDVIQVSNLNRQFLFREKHLRKPKASTAAAAAIAMNPQLKGRIFARLDKVFPGTEHIFTDRFFKQLSIVTNALDNIQARRYVDNRCVTARTPLLESGTLGPKGHVQVILPGKTESYGSQQDPENQNDIPICTLKMFPEQTVHCVEWARDQFGKLFTQNPQSLNRVLEPDFLEGGGPKDSADLTALHKAVKMLKKMPKTWNDCIFMARLKFQKYFVNDIRQLLYTYPLDKMTKEGKPFWSSPKRPPFQMIFDKGDALHQTFLIACATLTAKIYGIQAPKNLRKDWESKAKLAMKSTEIKVPDFKPDKRKAEAIAKEVQNEQEKKKGDKAEQEEEEPESTQANMDVGLLIQLLKELKQKLPTNVKISEEQQKQKGGPSFQAFPEQFEKDNDENCHIDFIYSLANCRSRNYKLQQMSWINVKLKAGRIVPALATTTASVSGLQTLQLVKIARSCTMEDHRNVFLNLALPSMTASEPGPAEVVSLNKDLKVTLWDRWDVKLGPDGSLGQMLDYLETTYKLQALDVMKGNTPIFFHAIMNAPGKQSQKKATLEKKMSQLLQIDIQGEKEQDKEGHGVYRDVTVTFRKQKVVGEDKSSIQDEMKVLKGIPPVRIYFDETEDLIEEID